MRAWPHPASNATMCVTLSLVGYIACALTVLNMCWACYAMYKVRWRVMWHLCVLAACACGRAWAFMCSCVRSRACGV
jgi:hypothetical protein